MQSSGMQQLGQAWVVESIAGAGVVDNSHATLQFLPGGRLAGNATCNRFLGNYDSDAEKLRIQTAGATKMACPPALMNQENKLLKLLPTVESFRIDKTGALIMMTANKTQIVARR